MDNGGAVQNLGSNRRVDTLGFQQREDLAGIFLVLLERDLVRLLHENPHPEAEFAAELRFVGKVDVEVHVIDRRPQRADLVVVTGGEVGHQLLELVAAFVRSNQVDVEADLPTNANEGRLPANEDRRLEAVTESVD